VTDIAVGTPVADRGDAALEGLVGMLVNTVVLRTQVGPADAFEDVLVRVRDGDLSALAHADVPFERVVEMINPERSQAYSPLFQVMLAFQSASAPRLELAGLSVSPLEIDRLAAPFDLSFELSEAAVGEGGASAVSGVVSFATDVFDASTVARFVGWFERVLAAVVADSSVVVGDVVLADAGQAELVGRWGAGVEVEVSGSVVGLLGAAVAADPEGVAVVSGSSVLTYRDLDVASNRLARVLIGVGVGPEAAVVVALDRGVSLVVALWAMWKAGGVYVPVDPGDPGERVGVVVAATDPVCVLTAGGAPAGVGSVPVIDVEAVDTSGVSGQAVAEAELLGPVGPGHGAYVIFTSGSTGTPKGVALTHGGVVNVAAAQRRWFGLSSGSRVLMAAAPTFDASVFEVLLAAGSGFGVGGVAGGGVRRAGRLAG
jgi:non-ribosomal peptide synthetase component F